MRTYARLKQAYDAYELAFAVLADRGVDVAAVGADIGVGLGGADESTWTHLVRAEQRAGLRSVVNGLRRGVVDKSLLEVPTSIPSVLENETFYRLVQVSSHLSHLAGEIADARETLMRRGEAVPLQVRGVNVDNWTKNRTWT